MYCCNVIHLERNTFQSANISYCNKYVLLQNIYKKLKNKCWKKTSATRGIVQVKENLLDMQGDYLKFWPAIKIKVTENNFHNEAIQWQISKYINLHIYNVCASSHRFWDNNISNILAWKVDQGHGVQLLEWCNSMANIKMLWLRGLCTPCRVRHAGYAVRSSNNRWWFLGLKYAKF